MTLSEKSAYLKGLMEGMELKTDSGEGKLLAAIVDLLGDVTSTVDKVEDTTIAISDELDEIESDLDAIEDYLMDDEDEDEDDDDFYMDDEDEDDELENLDDDSYDFSDTTVYEVQCGKCGEVIDFDEEQLESGSIVCPNCGELLEFTTEDEEN